MGFLLFSVALNDLADEAIDRVNLPGDRRRPLVAGTATRRELVAMVAEPALRYRAEGARPAILIGPRRSARLVPCR